MIVISQGSGKVARLNGKGKNGKNGVTGKAFQPTNFARPSQLTIVELHSSMPRVQSGKIGTPASTAGKNLVQSNSQTRLRIQIDFAMAVPLFSGKIATICPCSKSFLALSFDQGTKPTSVMKLYKR